MSLNQTQVSQLYVAIFGRASEKAGNAFWQGEGDTLSVVADKMLASDGGTWYFGDKLNNNQQFIEHIYKNTLGKTADQDPDGIAHWVAKLEGGESKGSVVEAMINALVTGDFTGDTLAIQAQQRFLNRLAVSDATAETNLTADLTDASMQKFANFINSVDHTPASKAAAIAAVEAAANASEPPVQI
ncbi:MAG: hypothetical protein CSA19_01220, partial [Deltaproteobacteria bacterium]